MKDRSSPQPLPFWVKLLNSGILVSGVDNATTVALCNHLADLGVFEKTGEEDWKLIVHSDSSLNIEEEVKNVLNELCITEKGFALRYFMKEPLPPQTANSSLKQKESEAGDKTKSNPELLSHKTSNLSNLQIVKKYGRQVESFIELEKHYTERLLGPNTTLKEARKIFNFILSRMKQKTKPRPWEQLSRRRHK